jgi:hypothetical protein
MNQITTENSTFKENPNTSNTKVTFKIRCPDCITLYEVDASKVNSVIPEFECPKCQCLFGFDYPPINPNSVLTFKIPAADFEFKKNCPKCQHFQSDKNQICESCGVVIENYLLLQNETYPKVSIELIKLWQKIIQDFDNRENHEQFIRKSIARDATDYALFKYKELSKTINDAKLCDYWIGNINETIKDKEDKDKIIIQRAKVSEFSFVTGMFNKLNHPNIQRLLFALPLLAGSFLILLGMFNTAHRNGIGGGIALLILTFGFTAFRRRD